MMNDIIKFNNKELVLKCFKLLIDNCAISNENSSNLFDEDYCKNQLCRIKFPVLIEIKNEDEVDQQVTDNNGRRRYYKEIITIEERNFLVSNFCYKPYSSHED